MQTSTILDFSFGADVVYIYVSLQKCVLCSTELVQLCYKRSPNYMIFKKHRGTIMI